MKLLLTSGWITNSSIINSLENLLIKPISESTLVFIPTASNAEKWDKNWLISDLTNLQKLNFKSIEITDFSAISENIWLQSFQNADILYFEWWNNHHLMSSIKNQWIDKILPDLLKTKVFVWVSAGSMIINPDLPSSFCKDLYNEDVMDKNNMSALNYVDFYILPHLNSPYFPNVNKQNIINNYSDFWKSIYVLDDNSAIEVNNWNIAIISEGERFKIK